MSELAHPGHRLLAAFVGRAGLTPARRLTALGCLAATVLLSACTSPGSASSPEEPAVVVSSREDPDGPEQGPNLFSASLGAAYWPGLDDVDPAEDGFPEDEFGSFDEWGVSLALNYERRVARWDAGSLWLGGHLSLASFENDTRFPVVTLPSGNTLDGDYTADLLVLAPTLAFRLDLAEGVDAFARGGAGYYRLALNESYDAYYDDIDDDEAFGGFIGLGLDIGVADQVSVRLEQQVHFVELEAFPDVLPRAGTVDGPVYYFGIGAALRF